MPSGLRPATGGEGRRENMQTESKTRRLLAEMALSAVRKNPSGTGTASSTGTNLGELAEDREAVLANAFGSGSVAEFLHERRDFDQLLAVVANERALDRSWRSLPNCASFDDNCAEVRKNPQEPAQTRR